jgi:hypothetical protein
MGDRIASGKMAWLAAVLSGFADRMLQRLASAQQLTLLHGDAHAGNFLLPTSGATREVRIVDWQMPPWLWETGCGVSDLAYLMVRFWPERRRQEMEEQLLLRYHRRLVEHGVAGYSTEQLWEDYRLCALQSLFLSIDAAFHQEPSRWYPQYELAMAACEHLCKYDSDSHNWRGLPMLSSAGNDDPLAATIDESHS